MSEIPEEHPRPGEEFTREDHPDRRRGDGDWKYRARQFWRDAVPGIAVLLAAVALFGTQSDVERQREGRGIAIDFLCAGQSASETVNRVVLLNTEEAWASVAGARKARGLFRGIPPPPPGIQAIRERLAPLYVEALTRETLRRTRIKATGLINRDGTLNCAALKRAARALPASSG